MFQLTGKVLWNMGNFSVKSVGSRQQKEGLSISQMVRVGSTEEDIVTEMLSQSYDKFAVGLDDVQILSLLPGEDWTEVIQRMDHQCFILKPMSVSFVVEKSLVLDDPRLPKLKISGHLPSIHCYVVDVRLVNMAAVLLSIPTPASAQQQPVDSILQPESAGIDEISAASKASGDALQHLEEAFTYAADAAPLVQATDLLLRFHVQDIQFGLSAPRAGGRKASGHPLISFAMEDLGIVLTRKTFEMAADVTLNDLALSYTANSGSPNEDVVTLVTSRHIMEGEIRFINLFQFDMFDSFIFLLLLLLLQDFMEADSSTCLLRVFYLEVDRKSPEFYSRHQSVVKKLDVDIRTLLVDFQREAVIDVLQVTNHVHSEVTAVTETALPPAGKVNPPLQPKLQPTKKLVTEGKSYNSK